MLSKIKNSVAVGLYAALAISLSCKVCTARENGPDNLGGGVCTSPQNAPDTFCGRALTRERTKHCTNKLRMCAHVCLDAILRNNTQVFCGKQQIGAIPSQFSYCNEEFQKCMNKPQLFKGKCVVWVLKWFSNLLDRMAYEMIAIVEGVYNLYGCSIHSPFLVGAMFTALLFLLDIYD